MDSTTDRFEPGNEIIPGPPWIGDEPKKIYPRSVSQLKLYRTCSLSWKYQKFDKIKNQPAAWLPQGTAFGKVAEEWERSGRSIGEISQQEIYYDSFDSEIEKYKEIQPDLSKWLTVGRTRIENDITARRQRGWDQWEKYRERALREPWKVWELPDGTPAVEVDFYVQFPFGPVRGKVDVVKDWGHKLTVNDLKTGNREKTALQLAVYAVALNETFGLDITEGSFYYAKDDTYSKLIDLSKLDARYLAGEFESMERGIENRVFNANVGGHCELCPAKGQCVEYNSI